jgi:hypothetical protein
VTTHFIGDVHGCAAEFAELLDALDHDPARDRLLLVGDAFSKGPGPLGVWRTIVATGAEMVLGNHDVRLRQHLRLVRDGEVPDYGNDAQREVVEALDPVADEVLAWLEELPLYINEPNFLLVHAGIHPELGLAGTTEAMFYTIRLWPPANGIEGPRWHDFYHPPPGTPPVVFGHDAPGGLVVRRYPDGTPYAIGLDSGCVYGGRLSAWVLEEDRIVQVPSRQESVFE